MNPSSSQPTQRLILNVEDKEAARYIRSRALTQAGYRAIDASTGGEALLMAATFGTS